MKSKLNIFLTIQFIIVLMVFKPVITRGQNQPPKLSNVRLTQNSTSKEFVFKFNLKDKENDNTEILLGVSSDNGKTYSVNTLSQSVKVGKNIQLKWKQDEQYQQKPVFKLIADDHQPFKINDLAAVDSIKMKETFEKIYGERNVHSKKSQNHLDSVQSFISHTLTSFGLNVSTNSSSYKKQPFKNIIGDKSGLAQDSVIILGAHYDTVKGSPGADDNTSGIVAILEIARLLQNYHFTKSIRFIAFDAEEMGLIGSHHYINSELKNSDKILAYLNFDMVGYFSNADNSQPFPAGMDALFPAAYKEVSGDNYRGNFLLLMANSSSSSLAKIFKKNASILTPRLKTVTIDVPSKGEMAADFFRASDHAGFWDKNVPALSIGDTGNVRNHNYHSSSDTKATINMYELSKVINVTFATVSELAGLCHCDVVVVK